MWNIPKEACLHQQQDQEFKIKRIKVHLRRKIQREIKYKDYSLENLLLREDLNNDERRKEMLVLMWNKYTYRFLKNLYQAEVIVWSSGNDHNNSKKSFIIAVWFILKLL